MNKATTITTKPIIITAEDSLIKRILIAIDFIFTNKLRFDSKNLLKEFGLKIVKEEKERFIVERIK